jgi:hypothetical protein
MVILFKKLLFIILQTTENIFYFQNQLHIFLEQSFIFLSLPVLPLPLSPSPYSPDVSGREDIGAVRAILDK